MRERLLAMFAELRRALQRESAPKWRKYDAVQYDDTPTDN